MGVAGSSSVERQRLATALRGQDPDRVWRATGWLADVGELRLGDALDVCVFLAEHEPDGDRGSRFRARLGGRLALELRMGLDHLDQVLTWLEVLPDPEAIDGLRRLSSEVDLTHAREAVRQRDTAALTVTRSSRGLKAQSRRLESPEVNVS